MQQKTKTQKPACIYNVGTKQKNKMADNKTKTEKDGAKDAKEKKAPVARKTAKEIIKERGNKGILAVMSQVAFKLGAENNFVGTGIEIPALDEKGKPVLDEKGKATFSEVASQHATIYHVSRPGGKIDKLDDKGDVLKNLIAKAKECHADLSHEPKEPNVYSKAVQAFIKEILKLQAPTENKSSVLSGVTFA